jgi:hypothetical protein
VDRHSPEWAARWAGSSQRHRIISYPTAFLPEGDSYRKRDESPSDLIRRLSAEFFPLNVPALAVPYLTKEPFSAKAFVLAVTQAWRRREERS